DSGRRSSSRTPRRRRPRPAPRRRPAGPPTRPGRRRRTAAPSRPHRRRPTAPPRPSPPTTPRALAHRPGGARKALLGRPPRPRGGPGHPEEHGGEIRAALVRDRELAVEPLTI